MPSIIKSLRVFYGVVGGLLGIYLNSTAALAEVEEVSEDIGRSSSSISTLPSDLPIELSIDNYDNTSDRDIAKFHLDDDIIPETVWSLHNNGPVHLDRIREGVRSQIYTGSDANFESPILWTRTAIALWSGTNLFNIAGLVPLPPPQFQVGSCGGSRAEQRELDYCSIHDDLIKKGTEQEDLSGVDGGDDTLENTDNKSISSSIANNESTPPLSTLTPISNPMSQGGLIALAQCDGVGVCAVINIDLLTTPINLPMIDFQAPPIDDLAPSIDGLAPSINDLAPPIDGPATTIDDLTPPINLLPPAAPPPSPPILVDVPPIFTPPETKPIPEASTWVMTVIGFSILVFGFGKKGRRRINPISIIDGPES